VLFTAFAALALVLAVVGIYGVISYTTAQRAHEMAIRSALGASTAGLQRLVFWSGMRPALVGIVMGLAATVATTGLMATFVFGVTAHDAGTLAAVSGIVAIVAGLASLLPARRITQVDSRDVLRS
jgi:ABC-type antimicrobial peptide transport system permease subunit